VRLENELPTKLTWQATDLLDARKKVESAQVDWSLAERVFPVVEWPSDQPTERQERYGKPWLSVLYLQMMQQRPSA
jgi:hypothetical protein